MSGSLVYVPLFLKATATTIVSASMTRACTRPPRVAAICANVIITLPAASRNVPIVMLVALSSIPAGGHVSVMPRK